MSLSKQNGISLQERDFDVLQGLFECRVMKLAHIADFYFDGKAEVAKKRVQKLKAAGYLLERARRIGDPSVLQIGKKAFEVLSHAGKLDAYPRISLAAFENRAQVSLLTLRHELEVMDVRAALLRAIREQPHLTIVEFSTWPLLHQFTTWQTSVHKSRRELVVKPDGFIRIKEVTAGGASEHLFFLEVDRSTESLKVVAQKATCYLNFYQDGGMAKRFGAKKAAFKSYPFRVLMACKTDSRRDNIARRLLANEAPILTQVWLATMEEIVHAALGAIWLCPRDVHEGVRKRPFQGNSL